MLLILGLVLLVFSDGVMSHDVMKDHHRRCSDPNAEPESCPRSCQPTCADRRPPETKICTLQCLEGGCVCKPGYILDTTDGKCIKEEHCPLGGDVCDGDYNATRVSCATVCPATCNSRGPVFCQACISNGCECKPGYIRSENNGPCIAEKDCPVQQRQCADPNAEPLDCPSSCQPTCADRRPPESRICTFDCLKSGCVCKSGYILDQTDGKCINQEHCPLGGKVCDGDHNATRVECATACPITCASHGPAACEACILNDCQCKPGYIRLEAHGPCINPKDCPGRQGCADPNAEPKSCPSVCQPTCEDRRSPESRPCTKNCLISGCVCKAGYILNKEEGRCIKIEKCPLGGNSCDGDHNATRAYCARKYPATCSSRYPRPHMPCTRNGCECKKGYIKTKNTNGVCINPKDCPAKCPIPDNCKRTCANPNPMFCPYKPQESNIDGCNCMDGYILSDKNGKCIRIEECPRGCNGDNYAKATKCPSPCPSTCSSPNEQYCHKKCLPIGCECDYGYILNEKTGRCVLPDNCPRGNPCGRNEQFVYCRVGCPTDYCPTDDSRAIVACDPPPPEYCLSGCVCKINHKKKSVKDPRCILSSTCPPVKCTRINEEWNPCTTGCTREYCYDYFNSQGQCNEIVLNCNPRCACKKSYYRNATDTCVSPHECPVRFTN